MKLKVRTVTKNHPTTGKGDFGGTVVYPWDSSYHSVEDLRQKVRERWKGKPETVLDIESGVMIERPGEERASPFCDVGGMKAWNRGRGWGKL